MSSRAGTLRLARNLGKLFLAYRQYRRRDLVCAQPPVRFWIEPTSRCNLRCPMCPTGAQAGGISKGSMDFGLYRSVIDQIAPFAVDVNLYFRGEPLFNPRLVDMIRYAKQKGLRTRLETNATAIEGPAAGQLLDSGLDFLSFSVDGYDKETYEKVRVGADFDRTLGNIRRLLQLKKERRRRAPYCLLQIIEMPEVKARSTAELRGSLREAFRGLPLNGFKVLAPHRFAGTIPESVTGNRYAYVENAPARVRYTPCPYLWFSMVIGWDGTIVPCCMNFFDAYPVGNVAKVSVLEAWNSPAMVHIRGKIASGANYEIPMCSECDVLRQRSLAGLSIKNLRDLSVFLRESAPW